MTAAMADAGPVEEFPIDGFSSEPQNRPSQPARQTMNTTPKLQWLSEPEAHDYPAAESYLNLLYPPSMAAKCVTKLRSARITEFKAKDIFRASGLSLLGVSNSHVEKDRQKIRSGQQVSPLLLVRDPRHDKVVIADGYLRLCAVYSCDEDALIPCKIVSPPPLSPSSAR